MLTVIMKHLSNNIIACKYWLLTFTINIFFIDYNALEKISSNKLNFEWLSTSYQRNTELTIIINIKSYFIRNYFTYDFILNVKNCCIFYIIIWKPVSTRKYSSNQLWRQKDTLDLLLWTWSLIRLIDTFVYSFEFKTKLCFVLFDRRNNCRYNEMSLYLC